MSVIYYSSLRRNNGINIDEVMDEDDVMETINCLMNKILNYTSNLDKTTPSLFDYEKNLDIESGSISSDSQNTSVESQSHNEIIECGINEFIQHCQKQLGLDKNLLFLSMMNLDKLLSKGFILTQNNIHKVIFLCMVETHKYYNDRVFINKDYAKECGISTKELLSLEIEFFTLIDFNLHINEEEFYTYKTKFYNMWKREIVLPKIKNIE